MSSYSQCTKDVKAHDFLRLKQDKSCEFEGGGENAFSLQGTHRNQEGVNRFWENLGRLRNHRFRFLSV